MAIDSMSPARRWANGLVAALLFGSLVPDHAAAAEAAAEHSAPTDAANKKVIQTDFALYIDGKFVIGTSGRGPSRSQAGAESEFWHGGFSTHYMTGDDPDAPSGVHLLNHAGESFSVTAKRGDETYEIEGSAKPLTDGTLNFISTLKHNDAVVDSPQRIVRDGEPASIELAGGGAAVTLEITLKQVAASLLPTTSPKPVDRAAATGDAQHFDIKPSEKLSDRRMKPPRYPPAAVRAHVQGKVMVNVVMDEKGVPSSAEVAGIEPPSAVELGGAAIVAALQWRYNPGVRDGKPVGGAVLVPVDFNLQSLDRSPMPDADPARPLPVSYRKLTAPQYPAHALQNRIAGKVFVRLDVAADGSVAAARVEWVVSESAAELGEAALQAIKTWQFSPATVDGVARASEVRVPVEFKLDDVPTPAAARPDAPLQPVANSLQTIVVVAPPQG